MYRHPFCDPLAASVSVVVVPVMGFTLMRLPFCMCMAAPLYTGFVFVSVRPLSSTVALYEPDM